MTAYLVEHPPARRQFRQRYATPTGLIVVHTAESAPDTVGPDDGTTNVAEFIRRRSDPGSYHWLADSDSRLQLVPHDQAAYGDGTGSNEFAIHISVATQAHRWPTLPQAWRDGAVEQLAAAARAAADWLKQTHGITVPARRVTRTQSDQGAAGFISHGERDPGRRTDPGPGFPWDRFLNLYAQEDDMTPEQAKQLAMIEHNTERLIRISERQRQRTNAQVKRIMGRLEHLIEVGNATLRDLTDVRLDVEALLEATEDGE